MNKKKNKKLMERLDLSTMIVPLIVILALFTVFIIMPEQSKNILGIIRNFLGNDMGIYYVVLGVGAVICSLYMAFSKYGNVKLGNLEKPKYNTFQWGTMIFTSTMAADILFYSLCEWALYGNDPHIIAMGGMQKWAPTYTLFHWGPIAWSFYIVLAVAFGFMIHVRGREKQKFSEACRPILGDRVDGIWGRIIDLLAVIALLAGTATTFSLATPLLARALGNVFGLNPGITLTILILLMIAFVYTLTVWFGMKGVSRLAGICAYLFFFLIGYVLIFGGECRYILETGISSIGNLAQNFIGMATWMDPARETSFVQNWSIFYWAYWLAWCVATPFFIGVISKGRTIRNTVLGAYACGLAGTFMSFIVLGNYGLSKQIKGVIDVVGEVENGTDTSQIIVEILNTLPLPKLVLVVLVITMIAFYSTTLDGITYVASSYSYKKISAEEEPARKIRGFWALLLIFLPVGLLFAQNSLYSLQGVTIIAAFPVGILLIMIVVSFFKDCRKWMKER